MGRFAAVIILFALVFAMVVPDDMGNSLASGDGQVIEARPDHGPAASADDAPASAPAPTLPLISRATVIERGDDGQFHLDIDVNGQRLPFLVDTGADMVALTIGDARQIGIVVEPQFFREIGVGAGGALRGQPVILDNISVAGHEIQRIEAVVIDGLTHNLLGQSVLRKMGKLELSGDRMTLE